MERAGPFVLAATAFLEEEFGAAMRLRARWEDTHLSYRGRTPARRRGGGSSTLVHQPVHPVPDARQVGVAGDPRAG